jgi:hypothetical protein
MYLFLLPVVVMTRLVIPAMTARASPLVQRLAQIPITQVSRATLTSMSKMARATFPSNIPSKEYELRSLIHLLMAGIQNGPIPTRLTLLSDLGKFSPGEKVRFLGW